MDKKEGQKLLFKKVKLNRTKSEEVSDILQKCNLDINITNSWNETLIYNCAKHAVNIPLMQWLYDNKCDPNIQNNRNFNAYSACLKWNHKNNKNKVLDWLHKNHISLAREYPDLPDLHNMIICYGDPEVYKWILSAFGKDSLNEKDKNGNTPLHISCHQDTKHNSLSALLWLLQNDADINIQNNEGDTALHLSAASGFSNCINLLMKENCDHTIKNNNGKISLDILEDNKDDIINHKKT
ncbi:unnamed protein product, partial [marine sediment metagenome]